MTHNQELNGQNGTTGFRFGAAPPTPLERLEMGLEPLPNPTSRPAITGFDRAGVYVDGKPVEPPRSVTGREPGRCDECGGRTDIDRMFCDDCLEGLSTIEIARRVRARAAAPVVGDPAVFGDPPMVAGGQGRTGAAVFHAGVTVAYLLVLALACVVLGFVTSCAGGA